MMLCGLCNEPVENRHPITCRNCKVCTRCKELLPRENFTPRPEVPRGSESRCRKCCMEAMREYRRIRLERMYRVEARAKNETA